MTGEQPDYLRIGTMTEPMAPRDILKYMCGAMKLSVNI